jgi:hypothetical protein
MGHPLYCDVQRLQHPKTGPRAIRAARRADANHDIMDAAEIQTAIQTAVAAAQQHISLSVKQVPQQQQMLASPIMAQ